MSKVKSPKGTFFKDGKGSNRQGGRDNIDSLQGALSETAKCDPCGCDECFGYWTQLNAETGELMAVWITGTEEYTLNIDTLVNALPILKALKEARTQ